MYVTYAAGCLVFAWALFAFVTRPQVGAQPAARWKMVAEETFEQVSLPAVGWLPDDHPMHKRDDGRFGDWGEFHRVKRGVDAPHGFRISARFGKDGWLTVESFSRASGTFASSLFSQMPDPDPKKLGNHVLRIARPLQTDGTVIRPTNPLPPQYRVCVRVGYASFGDGIAGPGRLNGYLGTETDPWKMCNPIKGNGFYWLAIIDDVPRPRNNVWIHHYRKVVIDSDNNQAGVHQERTSSNLHNGSAFACVFEARRISSGQATRKAVGKRGETVTMTKHGFKSA